ncbi:MAG: ABC transporter ATP-binding protein [Acidimicrobiales bacterium]
MSATTSTPTSGPLLEVREMRTGLRTGRAVVQAVDGVSFTLERGRTLGIVGESGSGKSVTVRSIMGILPDQITVTTGQVLFEGTDVTALPRERARHFWGVDVAMVFQDPMTSLNPVVRIGRQITESLRYHLSMSKAEARARALELLDLVGIGDPGRRFDQYPHELSGGMRQRVTIAIALACEPKLLIADEPTTALDVTVQKQILDLLAHLADTTDMAMILITHDLGVVAGRADEIAVMYAGRFVEVADTATLFSQMRHPYTRALFDSIPKIEQPSHTPLRAISGRPPDLSRPRVGCSFAPRCANAQPDCRENEPALLGDAANAPGHLVACFHPVGG